MNDRSDIRKWLPQSALNDGRLTQWVEETVRTWARRWVSPDNQSAISVSEARHASGSVTHAAGNCLGLHADGDGRREFAEAAIATSLEGADVNNTDTALLKGLVEAALSDLMVHLVGDDIDVVNKADTLNAYKAWDVRLGGRGIATIRATETLCIDIRKSLAGSSRLGAIAPIDLERALDDKDVTFNAKAGSLLFDLKTLSSLKPGDVFELKHGLADSFGLQVDGVDCAGLNARYILTQAKKGARKMPAIVLETSDE